jgi:cytochrome c oxidase subunit I
VLALGFLLVLVYVLIALRWGPPAGPNPWHSRGFEWGVPSPPPSENWPEQPVVTHGPHEYDKPEPGMSVPSASHEPKHAS